MTGNKSILMKALRTSMVAVSLAVGAGMIAATTGHNPLVKTAHAETQKLIKLGLHKSAVVRLPAGVKDVLLGNPEVADVVLRSKRTLYVFARKLGQTNIFLLDREGNPISKLAILVAINPVPLQKLIREVLPEANIHVKTVENQILLSGTVKTPAEANKALQLAQNFAASFSSRMLVTTHNDDVSKGAVKVVNAIKITGKDQVMIKVRLAEIQRTVIKQLRANINEFKFSKGDLSGVIGMVFPFSLGNVISDASGNFKIGGNPSVDGFLQMLERDGLMRLLAEPTLTAISGEAANFIAGGEVPVLSGIDMFGRYIYKFKEFGVILGFSPMVLSEGRISLKVNVEVSELSSRYSLPIDERASIPGFEKRKAETTVELPSGGTLALAGMIREQTKHNVDGVPGLKNLPILGALFRSRDFLSEQTELVVLATPYIVKPTSEKKFRTPLDRLNMASDIQSFFLGRLHRLYGGDAGPKGDGRVYHGDIGFILD